jgi:hypothetical protein
MGKTTLYHPISLLVIRGALDQCGVKCGRIHQTAHNKSRLSSWYDIEIVSTPESLDSLPFKQWAKAFQDCFAADITVIDLTAKLDATKHAFRITLSIYVTLMPDKPLERAIEAPDWLNADEGDIPLDIHGEVLF